MKTLQIFKQLRAFSTRTMYACMIGTSIFSLNGCNNTIEEQIIPQEVSIQDMAKEYNLKKVEKPTGNQKVIYLKDMAKANQFFQNLKVRKEHFPDLEKKANARVNNEMALSHGYFTFLNGQTATIHFNTHPDGVGEIERASVEGQELEITNRGRDYFEMIKWGYIAVPYSVDEFTENYFYYLAPIAIYRAVLVNGGWSSVQLLNQFEQGNFEGEGGTWEEVWIRNPYLPGYDLPVIDPWEPHLSQD